jgi:hypothetical protein
MLIHIDGEQHPILPHVTLEIVHRQQRPEKDKNSMNHYTNKHPEFCFPYIMQTIFLSYA